MVHGIDDRVSFREAYCAAYQVRFDDFNYDLFSRSLKCNSFFRWVIRFLLVRTKVQLYSTILFTYLGDTTDSIQFNHRLRELCRFSKSNSNILMRTFKIVPSYSKIVRISQSLNTDAGSKFVRSGICEYSNENHIFESLGM